MRFCFIAWITALNRAQNAQTNGEIQIMAHMRRSRKIQCSPTVHSHCTKLTYAYAIISSATNCIAGREGTGDRREAERQRYEQSNKHYNGNSNKIAHKWMANDDKNKRKRKYEMHKTEWCECLTHLVASKSLSFSVSLSLSLYLALLFACTMICIRFMN